MTHDPRAGADNVAVFWYIIAALTITFFLFWLFPPVSVAKAQDQDNCRGFIPAECCCTSNYCRTITGNEVRYDGAGWAATASGNRVQNVYPSQDGDMILCDNNGKGLAYCVFLDFGS